MSQPSSSPANADDLFDDYVRRVEAGEALDLEALCTAHPQQAEALRLLERDRQLLSRLLPGPLSQLVDSTASLFSWPDLAEGSEIDPQPDSAAALLTRIGVQDRGWRRYWRLAEIGRGGMGIVLRVFDQDLRRKLAMKIALSPRGSGSAEHEHAGIPGLRLLEEARVASHLDHPGIVPVHEIGLSASGAPYVTMREIHGETLRVVLENVRTGAKGWSQVRALGVILKVCETMSYAHAQGIIHRDLKPANVMVGRFGEVYVVDWGVSHVLEAGDRSASPFGPRLATGSTAGTPAYMSPEQATNDVERYGPWTDVYAVGAMLYQLSCGQAPYVSADTPSPPEEILRRVIAGPPKPLVQHRRTVPSALVAICEKAMSRTPENRYRDMQSLANDLEAYMEGRVVAAYRTGAWAEAWTWMRRNRAVTASLAVVVVIVGLWLTFAVRANQRARGRESVVQLQTELDRLRGFTDDWKTVAPGTSGPPVHEQWVDMASRLVAWLPGQRDHLATLRSRLSPTHKEIEAMTASHPRRDELIVKRAELSWRDRVLGSKPWPSMEAVDAEMQKQPPIDSLRTMQEFGAESERVFQLVRPDLQRLYGQEPLALRLARRLVDAAEAAGKAHPRFRDTLAFALFRLGKFDAAVAVQQKVIHDPSMEDDLATRPALRDDPTLLRNERAMRSDLRGNHDVLVMERDAWSDGSERRFREALDADVAGLEQEISDLAASKHVSEDTAWLLPRATVVTELERLETRLHRAEDALRSSRWQTAIDAIRASPHYHGLVISPQVDLIPLGEDAHSGLWEFAHLPTGEPPARKDGKYEIRRDTSLVLVLLPAGMIPVERGREAAVRNDRPLEAFFISKYEMTHHQWLRLGGRPVPGSWPERIGWPAVAVSWAECSDLLRCAGGWLRLPTRDQWEYACRGGTATHWWTGDEPNALRRAANFDFEDGIRSSRLVGRLEPNPFGLHDVHGNVREWCDDRPDVETQVRRGAVAHAVMGGSYVLDPRRNPRPLEGGSGDIEWQVSRSGQDCDEQTGLRPVRCVTR